MVIAEQATDPVAFHAEGPVWSARWGGWSLVRYSAPGIEKRRIRFPASQVSSITFGGDDLTDMYVTTAARGGKAKTGPRAGALFRLRLGIQGMPEFYSRIQV